MDISSKSIKPWQDVSSLPLGDRAFRGMYVGFIYGALLSLPIALLVFISSGDLIKTLSITLVGAAFVSLVLVIFYVFKILSIPNSLLMWHVMGLVIVLCIAATVWVLKVFGAYAP